MQFSFVNLLFHLYLKVFFSFLGKILAWKYKLAWWYSSTILVLSSIHLYIPVSYFFIYCIHFVKRWKIHVHVLKKNLFSNVNLIFEHFIFNLLFFRGWGRIFHGKWSEADLRAFEILMHSCKRFLKTLFLKQIKS